jgi:hypothetical protein
LRVKLFLKEPIILSIARNIFKILNGIKNTLLEERGIETHMVISLDGDNIVNELFNIFSEINDLELLKHPKINLTKEWYLE